MKTEKTATPVETRKNAFETLLRTFEDRFMIAEEEERADLLYSVCYAMTYSVLKKVLTVSTSSVMYGLRSDLYAEKTRNESLAYLDPLATSSYYNKDGEEVTEQNGQINSVIVKKLRETSGDGVDLVHDGVVKLLEEIARATDLSSGYLERPYKVRRLKKKVRIQSDESVGGWETVETTPIQEVFKYIRRKIMLSNSIESASSKYVYLEDLSTDEESGWEEVVYRRLSKYSQLADYVYDFNGAPTVITSVGSEDVTNVEETVASMGLTARESAVLKYRLSGYGNKAIATALGITENSVKGARNTIRKKAERIGLTVDLAPTDPEETDPEETPTVTVKTPTVNTWDSMTDLLKTVYAKK